MGWAMPKYHDLEKRWCSELKDGRDSWIEEFLSEVLTTGQDTRKC